VIEVEIDTQAVHAKSNHKLSVKAQARVSLVEVTHELHATAVLSRKSEKTLAVVLELSQDILDVRLQRIGAG
jgi:hypothetical protein